MLTQELSWSNCINTILLRTVVDWQIGLKKSSDKKVRDGRIAAYSNFLLQVT